MILLKNWKKQKEKQPKLTEEQLKELHKLIEEHPHFRNKTLNEVQIYLKIKLEEESDNNQNITNKKEIGSSSGKQKDETNKENDTDNELEIIEKPIEIINISSDTEEEKRKNKKPPSKKHHKSGRSKST
uniref:Uncharacterized protein n=1 Tax=Meloidogyne enterolobii TaxID=390850 RepID=A0A6V7X8T5_MELEN|nr:unnamed protein product [Meloidogyne enterolobii]